MILILSRLSPSDTKPSSRLCLMLRKWSSMCLVQKLTKSPRTPSLPALKRYNAPGSKHQVRNHKEALYKLCAHTNVIICHDLLGISWHCPEYPEWWIWLFDQIPVVKYWGPGSWCLHILRGHTTDFESPCPDFGLAARRALRRSDSSCPPVTAPNLSKCNIIEHSHPFMKTF